jgi:ornithine carbamoyltransferase
MEERLAVLARARELKAGRPLPPSGLRVGALFFNPSLRTRVSFEQAARRIGADCQTLNVGSDAWPLEFDPEAVMDGDASENIVEAAGVLGRCFHILGVRAFPQSKDWAKERTEPVLTAFARHLGRPLISLEGSLHHPCQSLADELTLREHFADTRGLKATLLWCWHPKALPMAVPHSFALQASLAGCDLTICAPEGVELDEGVLSLCRQAGAVRIVHDRREGLRGAQVVYAKSWGRQDGEPHDEDLRGWILDKAALFQTSGAKVMHCLPVRRNVVISGDVLESPASIVLDQAENRLWTQAALIEHLARESGL